jgi:hypothetical protein
VEQRRPVRGREQGEDQRVAPAEAADEAEVQLRDGERDHGHDAVHQRQALGGELAEEERVARRLQDGVRGHEAEEGGERLRRRARLPLADIDEPAEDLPHSPRIQRAAASPKPC